MSKPQPPLSPGEREAKRLLDLGADALANDIENLIADHATLLVQGVLHRMVQKSCTYEEAWADIGKTVLSVHTARLLIRTGEDYDKQINEQTGSGDLD